MVAATTGKAKLAGLIVDRKQVEGGTLEQRLLNLIKSLDDKVKSEAAQPGDTGDADENATPYATLDGTGAVNHKDLN